MNPRLVSLNAALGISSGVIAARGLRVCEEASSLEVAEVGADGREHLLVAAAAEAWCNLKSAALGDGVPLFIVSAFRSIERQSEIVRRKLEACANRRHTDRVCSAWVQRAPHRASRRSLNSWQSRARSRV